MHFRQADIIRLHAIMMNNAGCSYRRKVTKRMAMRSSKKKETGAEEYGFSNVCCGHAR